jgi:F0F1-type ATP synthase delta subunit
VELKLPIGVVSQVDIARLIRELNSLEDFFTSAKTRQAGTPMTPPRLTRMLDALAHDNKCNLLDGTQRQKLTESLDQVLKQSPLLHISFASDPSPRALEIILAWLRTNIHQQTLLQVGLQPTIAAGCMLRTPNKVFDMSLRSHLNSQEPYLAKLIAGAAHGQ